MKADKITDALLRKAYNDCRAEYRIAKQVGLPSQMEIERIKAMAVWRWIDARKGNRRVDKKLLRSLNDPLAL